MRISSYGNSTAFFINNLTINSGYFGLTGFNCNLYVYGNITNNGVIYADGGWTGDMMNLIGANPQTISGSGTWNQINTNPGTNIFPGLTINNTYWNGTSPAVLLNQNMGLQNTLNLTNGILGGTGTLTLGNGTGYTLTTNISAGAWPLTTAGSSTPLATAYNLTNMTYYVNYNTADYTLSTYTTGGELALTGMSNSTPAYGNVNINTGLAGGVTLGRNATAYALQINNSAGSILHMNGYTLLCLVITAVPAGAYTTLDILIIILVLMLLLPVLPLTLLVQVRRAWFVVTRYLTMFLLM